MRNRKVKNGVESRCKGELPGRGIDRHRGTEAACPMSVCTLSGPENWWHRPKFYFLPPPPIRSVLMYSKKRPFSDSLSSREFWDRYKKTEYKHFTRNNFCLNHFLFSSGSSEYFLGKSILRDSTPYQKRIWYCVAFFMKLRRPTRTIFAQL